jgi:prepilin-type processing-associated H-X9-DG protein
MAGRVCDRIDNQHANTHIMRSGKKPASKLGRILGIYSPVNSWFGAPIQVLTRNHETTETINAMFPDASCRKLKARSQAGRFLAFTLVELLVVFAIIAILASILLPVLSRVKLKATLSDCLDNQKQLALAFSMYVNDNSQNLVNYNPANLLNAGGFWGLESHAPGDWTSPEFALHDVQSCLSSNNVLFQYAPDVQVYRCPGDPRINFPIGSGNSVDWAYDSYAITENVEPIPGFTQGYTKMAQIKRVSDCMIFAEQSDTRGYNEATFVMSVTPLPPKQFTFVDVFACNHGNVCSFSFADGHVESRKWLDHAIIGAGAAIRSFGCDICQYPGSPYTPDPSGHDAPWLIQHCVAPDNP